MIDMFAQYWTEFLAVTAVHMLAVMSPGPDFAIVVKNSLVQSRKAGFYTAIGIALALSVHIAYCLLGIAWVISQSIILFNVFKYAGAAYLIYIGIQGMRATPEKMQKIRAEKRHDMSALAAFKIGFLTNVLNVKATLFFLSLFTVVISPTTPAAMQMVYGVEMIVVTGIWFTLVAYVFSVASVRAKITGVQHWIERVMGVVLVALGIKIALADQ